MKRLIAILLLGLFVFGLSACGKQEPTAIERENLKHQEMVTEATKQLKQHWKQTYQDEKFQNTDGYFEIKNLRVITIRDNEVELFQDVAYVIEYDLYTDYMGTAPYYEHCDADNNVVVYQDGTMAVTSNYIQAYRNKTYQTDYTGFMEAIDDYQGQYNSIEKLK